MYLLDIKTIHSRLKSSAKKRGIHFNLQLTDLYELSYPLTCPILGIPLQFNRGKVQDNSYSIDRIDSSLGYVQDNIQVISYRANMLKNNATVEELELLATKRS